MLKAYLCLKYKNPAMAAMMMRKNTVASTATSIPGNSKNSMSKYVFRNTQSLTYKTDLSVSCTQPKTEGG